MSEMKTHATERDELLQVALDFIQTLTGMEPPPIEVAPPEVFAPFRSFVDRVQEVTRKTRTWQPIETAPKDGREMFVVRAFDIDPIRGGQGRYTSDPYCVWRGSDGELVRWPHSWPPTHWIPLPPPPGDAP